MPSSPQADSGVRAPLHSAASSDFPFRIPFESAVLREYHQGTNGRLIIHIQDAHANLSGQVHLAAALEDLMKQTGSYLVLVEGSSQDVTLSEARASAEPQVWRRTAKRFLQDGVISGEEYLNLTTDHPMKLAGIEEEALYDQSLMSYTALIKNRKDVLLYLHRSRISLDRVKSKSYPPSILKFESRKEFARTHEAGFETGLEDLFALLQEASVVPDASRPEAKELLSIRAAERSIDFDQANREQSRLLSLLSAKGARKELEEFTRSFERVKNQQVSRYLILSGLLQRAKDAGIDPRDFPELAKYAGYLKDFSELKMDALLSELDSLEEEAYERLLPDADSKTLHAIDRFLELLQKAYSVKMTSNEFRSFLSNEPDFATPSWHAFVNKKLAELGYFGDLIAYRPLLEEAREPLAGFYDLVGKRDLAFLRNAKRIMDAEKRQTAFLIAGGYHSEHLTELMRSEGYSYAVLSPVVAYESDQAKYETLLLSSTLKQRGAAQAASIGLPAMKLRADALYGKGSRLTPEMRRAIDAVVRMSEKERVSATAGSRALERYQTERKGSRAIDAVVLPNPWSRRIRMWWRLDRLRDQHLTQAEANLLHARMVQEEANIEAFGSALSKKEMMREWKDFENRAFDYEALIRSAWMPGPEHNQQVLQELIRLRKYAARMIQAINAIRSDHVRGRSALGKEIRFVGKGAEHLVFRIYGTDKVIKVSFHSDAGETDQDWSEAANRELLRFGGGQIAAKSIMLLNEKGLQITEQEYGIPPGDAIRDLINIGHDALAAQIQRLYIEVIFQFMRMNEFISDAMRANTILIFKQEANAEFASVVLHDGTRWSLKKAEEIDPVLAEFLYQFVYLNTYAAVDRSEDPPQSRVVDANLFLGVMDEMSVKHPVLKALKEIAMSPAAMAAVKEWRASFPKLSEAEYGQAAKLVIDAVNAVGDVEGIPRAQWIRSEFQKYRGQALERPGRITGSDLEVLKAANEDKFWERPAVSGARTSILMRFAKLLGKRTKHLFIQMAIEFLVNWARAKSWIRSLLRIKYSTPSLPSSWLRLMFEHGLDTWDQRSIGAKDGGGKNAWSTLTRAFKAIWLKHFAFKTAPAVYINIGELWDKFLKHNQALVDAGNQIAARYDASAEAGTAYSLTSDEIAQLDLLVSRMDFTAEFKEMILDRIKRLPGPYLIRSSHRLEDSFERNLAGFLISERAQTREEAVEAVKVVLHDTVRKTWLAQNTGSGRKDFPHKLIPGMGLGFEIVQTVVPTVAGTMVTQTHRRNQGYTIIEAVRGDAAQAVQGHPQTSTFMFNFDRHLMPGAKRYMYFPSAAEANNRQPILSETQVRLLEKIGGLFHRIVGAPMDIEWGLVADPAKPGAEPELYIFQIRPFLGAADEQVELHPEIRDRNVTLGMTPNAVGTTGSEGVSAPVVVFPYASHNENRERIKDFENAVGPGFKYIGVMIHADTTALQYEGSSAQLFFAVDQDSRNAHNIMALQPEVKPGLRYANGRQIKDGFETLTYAPYRFKDRDGKMVTLHVSIGDPMQAELTTEDLRAGIPLKALYFSDGTHGELLGPADQAAGYTEHNSDLFEMMSAKIEAAPPVKPPQSKDTLVPIKILIMDANRTIGTSLKTIFGAFNPDLRDQTRFTIVENHALLLSALEKEHFNIIICDMEDADEALMRKLEDLQGGKGIPAGVNPPALILTSQIDLQKRSKVSPSLLQNSIVWTKPFDTDRMPVDFHLALSRSSPALVLPKPAEKIAPVQKPEPIKPSARQLPKRVQFDMQSTDIIRILYVEDQDDQRRMMMNLFGTYLSGYGLDFQPCATADQAMDVLAGKAEGFDPDIVITDVGVPSKNEKAYYEMLAELAGQGKKIIILSGQGPDDIPPVLAGAGRVWRKPFSMKENYAEVNQMISDILSRRGPVVSQGESGAGSGPATLVILNNRGESEDLAKDIEAFHPVVIPPANASETLQAALRGVEPRAVILDGDHPDYEKIRIQLKSYSNVRIILRTTKQNLENRANELFVSPLWSRRNIIQMVGEIAAGSRASGKKAPPVVTQNEVNSLHYVYNRWAQETRRSQGRRVIKKRERQHPLSALTLKELGFLLKGAPIEYKKTGERIIREGEEQDDDDRPMYVVLSGKFDTLRRAPGGQREIKIRTTRRRGEIFGAYAAVYRGPRTSSVVATSRARVIKISSKRLLKFTKRHPEFAGALREFAKTKKDITDKIERLGRINRSTEKAQEIARILSLKIGETLAPEDIASLAQLLSGRNARGNLLKILQQGRKPPREDEKLYTTYKSDVYFLHPLGRAVNFEVEGTSDPSSHLAGHKDFNDISRSWNDEIIEEKRRLIQVYLKLWLSSSHRTIDGLQWVQTSVQQGVDSWIRDYAKGSPSIRKKLLKAGILAQDNFTSELSTLRSYAIRLGVSAPLLANGEHPDLDADLQAFQAITVGKWRNSMTGIFDEKGYREVMAQIADLAGSLAGTTLWNPKENALTLDAFAAVRKKLSYEAARKDLKGASSEEYEKSRRLFDLLHVQDHLKDWELDRERTLKRAVETNRLLDELAALKTKKGAVKIDAGMRVLLLQAADLLLTDAKNPWLHSWIAFSSRAPPLANPVYIGFDVRNLAYSNMAATLHEALESQGLLRGRGNRRQNRQRVNEIALTAAGTVTQQLRDNEKKVVFDILPKYLKPQYRQHEWMLENVLVQIGGDEMFIVAEMEWFLNRQAVTDFLAEARRAAKARAAATFAVRKFRSIYKNYETVFSENVVGHAELMQTLDDEGSSVGKRLERAGIFDAHVVQDAKGKWFAEFSPEAGRAHRIPMNTLMKSKDPKAVARRLAAAGSRAIRDPEILAQLAILTERPQRDLLRGEKIEDAIKALRRIAATSDQERASEAVQALQAMVESESAGTKIRRSAIASLMMLRDFKPALLTAGSAEAYEKGFHIARSGGFEEAHQESTQDLASIALAQSVLTAPQANPDEAADTAWASLKVNDSQGHRNAAQAVETSRGNPLVNVAGAAINPSLAPDVNFVLFVNDIQDPEIPWAREFVRLAQNERAESLGIGFAEAPDAILKESFELDPKTHQKVMDVFAILKNAERKDPYHIVLLGGLFSSCLHAQVRAFMRYIEDGPAESLTYITLPLPAILPTHRGQGSNVEPPFNDPVGVLRKWIPEALAIESDSTRLKSSAIPYFDTWRLPILDLRVILVKDGKLLRDINPENKRTVVFNFLSGENATREFIAHEARHLTPGNEYYYLSNVSRKIPNLKETEKYFDEAVTLVAKSIAEQSGASGPMPAITVIGAGAGPSVYSFWRKFPDVKYTMINKSPIVVDRQSVINELGEIDEGVSDPRQEAFMDFFDKEVMSRDANEALPLASGTQDVVWVASETYRYIRNKAGLMREMKRVLKPGGMGFIEGFYGFEVEGMALEDFFTELNRGGSAPEYLYIPLTTDHIYEKLLRITNHDPERPFPQLAIVKEDSVEMAITDRGPNFGKMLPPVYEILYRIEKPKSDKAPHETFLPKGSRLPLLAGNEVEARLAVKADSQRIIPQIALNSESPVGSRIFVDVGKAVSFRKEGPGRYFVGDGKSEERFTLSARDIEAVRNMDRAALKLPQIRSLDVRPVGVSYKPDSAAQQGVLDSVLRTLATGVSLGLVVYVDGLTERPGRMTRAAQERIIEIKRVAAAFKPLGGFVMLAAKDPANQAMVDAAYRNPGGLSGRIPRGAEAVSLAPFNAIQPGDAIGAYFTYEPAVLDASKVSSLPALQGILTGFGMAEFVRARRQNPDAAPSDNLVQLVQIGSRSAQEAGLIRRDLMFGAAGDTSEQALARMTRLAIRRMKVQIGAALQKAAAMARWILTSA